MGAVARSGRVPDELADVRAEVATGVVGYTEAHREFVEKLNDLLPTVARRLRDYMEAEVENVILPNGVITRLVKNPQDDMTDGQLRLASLFVKKVMPSVGVVSAARGQGLAPGAVVNVTIHTVGPALPPQYGGGQGVIPGQAVQVSQVTFRPPVTIDAEPIPQEAEANEQRADGRSENHDAGDRRVSVAARGVADTAVGLCDAAESRPAGD